MRAPSKQQEQLNGSVKSARRVLDIFEFFVLTQRPATMSAIAEGLNMPKSSCVALLSTLEKCGYIYSQSQHGYYPTRRWLDYAKIIADSDPLVLRIQPTLIKLRDETGETVILGRRVEDRILYIEVVESQRMLRSTARAGQFKPVHGTASGKALLGSLSPSERHQLISKLKLTPLTPKTIIDPELLERHVAAGAARGWHVSVGENEPDATAVAAPARIVGDTYVLVVAGPTQRLEGRLDDIGKRVRAICRQMETDKLAKS
jgi:DNA-binding IclR family transcriptional regulator